MTRGRRTRPHADGPSQLGGTGARVRPELLGARADRLAGPAGVDPLAGPCLERLLHEPVLPRVKRQDRDAPARARGRTGAQPGRRGARRARRSPRSGAPGTSAAPDRLPLPPAPARAAPPGPRGRRWRGRASWRSARASRAATRARAISVGVRLVGVLAQKRREALPGDSGEEVGGGEASRRVHPHVERAVRLERESARRVVELHRGDAEVGEDEVDGRQAQLSEDLREAREAGPPDGQDLLAEAEPPKARLGSRQLERVGVEADRAGRPAGGAAGARRRGLRGRASRRRRRARARGGAPRGSPRRGPDGAIRRGSSRTRRPSRRSRGSGPGRAPCTSPRSGAGCGRVPRAATVGTGVVRRDRGSPAEPRCEPLSAAGRSPSRPRRGA